MHFENLANETIYEIFDYLDMHDVYHGFMDLNSRFRKLLMSSSLPLKINMKYLSKSNVRSYYERFIFPNLDRIQFLYLWNPFIIKLACPSAAHLQKFQKLETLVLDDVRSEDVLGSLTMLPNLRSLIINQTGPESGRYINFDSVICLPKLKYCKISYPGEILFSFFHGAPNNTSPIEHLVINGQLALTHLFPILYRLPQLSRLSIDHLFDVPEWQRKSIDKVVNKLTHVYLNLKDMPFDRFQLLATCILQNVQVLRISRSNDPENLNARRWERLITSSMTHLRVFDIQCLYNNYTGSYATRSDKLIRQFKTQFWTERQWYFAYQHSPRSFYVEEKMFFSIQPYRRRSYTLCGVNEQCTTSLPVDTNLNLVRHVHLQNETMIDHSSVYFPNARELTTGKDCFLSLRSSIANLNRILPLRQLNQIILDSNSSYFPTILELLQLIPNCYKLTVASIKTHHGAERELESIRNSPKFELASQMNQIKDLTVKSVCTSREIQLLTRLIPRLQHLTINVEGAEIHHVMKFLLKTNENTLNSISLNIQTTDDIYIEKVLNQLQLNRQIDQFYITETSRYNWYLWF